MSSNEIVIITGSSGYIGSALTKKLSANFKIIGLDRDIPDKRVEGVDYYALDFSSSDELYEVIKGLRQKFGASIKSVVHLVAYYSFSGEESDLYQRITVEGSGNLLRILNEFFQVEQFIFSSTMLVHRPAPSGKEIDEESPVSPSWPYPESKVKAEKIIAKEKGIKDLVQALTQQIRILLKKSSKEVHSFAILPIVKVSDRVLEEEGLLIPEHLILDLD